MTRQAILLAVVAMIAIGTSTTLVFGAPATTNDVTMTLGPTAEVADVTQNETETANITFENQTSNGTAIVVAEVVVPEGGFVAVHAANESVADADATSLDTVNNSTLGADLGNSTYLEAGTHENVTVELEETLTGSQLVIVDAHQDSNDNQQFDEQADALYVVDDEIVADSAFVTVEQDEVEEDEVEQVEIDIDSDGNIEITGGGFDIELDGSGDIEIDTDREGNVGIEGDDFDIELDSDDLEIESDDLELGTDGNETDGNETDDLDFETDGEETDFETEGDDIEIDDDEVEVRHRR